MFVCVGAQPCNVNIIWYWIMSFECQCFSVTRKFAATVHIAESTLEVRLLFNDIGKPGSQEPSKARPLPPLPMHKGMRHRSSIF